MSVVSAVISLSAEIPIEFLSDTDGSPNIGQKTRFSYHEQKEKQMLKTELSYPNRITK